MPYPRIAAVPLLAALLVPACGDGAGAERDRTGDPAAEADVRALLDRYYGDFSARDWDRFADHFWPGAILSTLWQAPGDSVPSVFVSTVPEYVARAPEGPGSQPIFEERLLEARVTVEGSLAQVWARYEARFGSPGDVMEWTGVDAFTLLRHDGRWRIVSLAYAGD